MAPHDPVSGLPSPRAGRPAGQAAIVTDHDGPPGLFPGGHANWRMPRSEWVHLVYLANLLWQPFFNPERSWIDWAIVGAWEWRWSTG